MTRVIVSVLGVMSASLVLSACSMMSGMPEPDPASGVGAIFDRQTGTARAVACEKGFAGEVAGSTHAKAKEAAIRKIEEYAGPNSADIATATVDKTESKATEQGYIFCTYIAMQAQGAALAAVAASDAHSQSNSPSTMSPQAKPQPSKQYSQSGSDAPVSGKPELVVQVGHKEQVASVAFSPDGRWALSGSKDWTLKLWEVATGREVRSFTGHIKEVNAVAFSPDGRRVLSGSEDGTVKLWEVATGREVWTVTPESKFAETSPILQKMGRLGSGGVTSVSFSPDGRWALSGSRMYGTLALLDIATGKQVRTLSAGDAEWINTVAFSPDGRYVLLGTRSNKLKLLEVTTGREVQSMAGHGEGMPSIGVTSVAFSPDGKMALSGGADKTVKLWDLATGRELRTMLAGISGIGGVVTSVAYSPNGKWALAGSSAVLDKTVAHRPELRLMEVATGREIWANSERATVVTAVVFSPDGQHLLAGSSDGMLSLRDVATGQEARNFTGYAAQVTAVALSPDGRWILSGSMDNTLKLWEVATGREVRTFARRESMAGQGVSAVAFSPDGRWALAGDSDSLVTLFDVATGREVKTFKGHAGKVIAVAFSPDGRLALSGDWMKTVKVWDVAAGREARTFVAGSSPMMLAIAFSPDGRWALSEGMGSTLKLWEVETGREVRTFSELASVHAIAFSPDGQWVLAGTGKQTKLMEVATGRTVWTVQSSSESSAVSIFSSVAFSPDGRFVLSGDNDGTPKLWDVATMNKVQTFTGHTGPITASVFSPDGRRVVTGSQDGTIRVWDAKSGTQLGNFIGMGTQGYVAVSPDQYYRASKGSVQGVVFRIGNKVYPFEQFDLKFNRPDLVLERLGLATPQQIEPYRRAYQKRLKKMGFTEAMLGSDFHLPEMTLLSKDLPLATDKKSLTLRVKATDDKYKLDRLNVFVNDVPIHGIAGIPLRDKQVQTVEQDVTVPLAAGKNKIQVAVLNVQGAESLKETVYLTSTAQPASRDVYLLSVGVSQYKNPAYTLQYAAKDAKDLAQAYQAAFGGARGQVFVKTLTDAQATKEAILKAKDWLKQSKVDDLVIVFVAGHGLTDQESNYYYGTYDISAEQPALRGLPYDDLDTLLDGIPALQKLLLLDTCFSGEIDKTEPPAQVAQANPPSGTEKVKVRAVRDTRGVRLNSGMVKFQEDWFADLRRGTGAVVISSSSGDEYSFEDAKWQNGVFTYSVIKGLKERAADANKDQTIRVSELQTYVSEQVKQLTNGGQHPTIRQENLENDFVVY